MRRNVLHSTANKHITQKNPGWAGAFCVMQYYTGDAKYCAAILYHLLTCFTYCSMAIVMEGAAGVGAGISIIRPASSTALWVVAPNAAIRVLFCLKSGKFLYNDWILDGLKKAITS